MDPQVLEMLGLSEGATPEEIAAAVKAMKEAATAAKATAQEEEEAKAKAAAEEEEKAKGLASAKTVPSLEKFVPRADYDAALARVKAVEDQVAKAAAEKLEAEIASEIDAALKAGKITPATKDHYVSVCKLEGGIEIFRNFVKDAPVVVSSDPIIDGKRPDGGKVALTAEERKLCTAMGLTEEEYRKAAA